MLDPALDRKGRLCYYDGKTLDYEIEIWLCYISPNCMIRFSITRLKYFYLIFGFACVTII